jgi:hypothetical protein
MHQVLESALLLLGSKKRGCLTRNARQDATEAAAEATPKATET